MERVTYRLEDGTVMMADGPKTRVDAFATLLDRCAAYENLEMEPEEIKAEIGRLKQWVNDLQSGMYVNCVYCGHRYGPADKTPVSMAAVLKQHIEQCPEHPMSKLKAELEKYREKEKHGVWFSAVETAKIAAGMQELAQYREQNKEALEYMGARASDRCDLMNGHYETQYSSYGNAAAGVKESPHEKPKCSECRNMAAEIVRNGRNIWYCMIAHTECLPHRIISRSRENNIPTKTSPKWCPLRAGQKIKEA